MNMGMNHQMNSMGMGSMNQQQGMAGMGPGNLNPMMNNGPDMSHNIGMGQPGNFPNNQYHQVRKMIILLKKVHQFWNDKFKMIHDKKI